MIPSSEWFFLLLILPPCFPPSSKPSQEYSCLIHMLIQKVIVQTVQKLFALSCCFLSLPIYVTEIEVPNYHSFTYHSACDSWPSCLTLARNKSRFYFTLLSLTFPNILNSALSSSTLLYTHLPTFSPCQLVAHTTPFHIRRSPNRFYV